MSRRRMIMLQQAKEEIPRERLVFSNAGDVIATDITKTNDGEVICGFAIIYQDFYSGYRPYWLYLILMSKEGINDNAVAASKFAKNAWVRFTDNDGIVHSISSTQWDCNLFNSVDEGIAYIDSININNLPIMNQLTGKSYEGQNTAGGAFSCVEAAQDLLEYYFGKI